MIVERKPNRKTSKTKSSAKSAGKTAQRRTSPSAKSAAPAKQCRIFRKASKVSTRKVHVTKRAKAKDLLSDLKLSKSSKSRIERVFKKMSKKTIRRK